MRNCPSTGKACYAAVCTTWPCDPAHVARLMPPPAPAGMAARAEVEESDEGVTLSIEAPEGPRFEIEG